MVGAAGSGCPDQGSLKPVGLIIGRDGGTVMRSVTIIPIAIFFTLAGCASGMDSAECVTADWRAIGYEDGSQGRGTGAFAARRKACADHGVTPKFEA